MKCWECELETNDIHHHHVVPRSRGGQKTVPLCPECHAKAHHRKGNMNTSALTKEGMRRARERGVKFGNPRISKARKKAALTVQENKRKFIESLMPTINEIRSTGVSTALGIAECLNRRGLKGRRGGRFHAATVICILKSHEAHERREIN